MRVLGLLAFGDTIKPVCSRRSARLHALGIQTVMLTGDNPGSAAVAQALGIDEVHAQLLPDDKARIIGELRNRGDVVAMVGDGLNDAPSLVAADVGLAVSTGTDVAMEVTVCTEPLPKVWLPSSLARPWSCNAPAGLPRWPRPSSPFTSTTRGTV